MKLQGAKLKRRRMQEVQRVPTLHLNKLQRKEFTLRCKVHGLAHGGLRSGNSMPVYAWGSGSGFRVFGAPFTFRGVGCRVYRRHSLQWLKASHITRPTWSRLRFEDLKLGFRV